MKRFAKNPATPTRARQIQKAIAPIMEAIYPVFLSDWTSTDRRGAFVDSAAIVVQTAKRLKLNPVERVQGGYDGFEVWFRVGNRDLVVQMTINNGATAFKHFYVNNR